MGFIAMCRNAKLILTNDIYKDVRPSFYNYITASVLVIICMFAIIGFTISAIVYSNFTCILYTCIFIFIYKKLVSELKRIYITYHNNKVFAHNEIVNKINLCMRQGRVKEVTGKNGLHNIILKWK